MGIVIGSLVTEHPPIPTAQDQTSLDPTLLIHTGNAGMVIHRRGQLRYEFSTEGRRWSVDLLDHINRAQAGVCTTFAYEEVFGVRDRLHWFIQLKDPNEYRKLLHMVEHDARFLDIAEGNWLPEDKGGGSWERMFVGGSLCERILLGQHGLTPEVTEEGEEPVRFVPPAGRQVRQSAEARLNSANSGAIVFRSADVRYEFREEGRQFAFSWQGYVNRELCGRVTSMLYEETFGRQDRIHWLIHLRSLGDYPELAALDRDNRTLEQVYRVQRVHQSKGGGDWSRLFVESSIRDVLLVPHVRTSPLP